MRWHMLVTAAAAVTLTGSALAGSAPAGAAALGKQVLPGARLWVARDFRGGEASAVAAGPGGRRVFVTGYGWSGRGTSHDYATAAYDAASGRRLWARFYNGSLHIRRNPSDYASSVAVSPDGRAVFVTGESVGRGTGYDYATVAYAAATGKQLWVSRYNGPANGNDSAASVAVSPDGTSVFVTGSSMGRGTGDDYATVAYSAATGRQLWVSRYDGPASRADLAASMALSPGGRTVFVTGGSKGQGSRDDYATVAYDAATGRQLWVSRYDGPANGADYAASVAVSPAGRTVFVTGTSWGGGTRDDYATVAYAAATGRQRWVSRYDGASRADYAASVAVSPDGTRVFVTGSSEDPATGHGYATVAYSAATGEQQWVSRYSGPWKDLDPIGGARSVAVSPDGTTVYVTGIGENRDIDAVYATVAYSAAGGTQLWVSRYNPASGSDVAAALAVSPDGNTVYVTGTSGGR